MANKNSFRAFTDANAYRAGIEADANSAKALRAHAEILRVIASYMSKYQEFSHALAVAIAVVDERIKQIEDGSKED